MSNGERHCIEKVTGLKRPLGWKGTEFD